MKKFLMTSLLATMLSTIGTHSHAYEYKYGSYSETTLKSAKAGNAEAQNTIGDGYYSGQGVEQDYKKAFEWYMKAANNGHLEAMNSVAFMYDNGEIDKPNVNYSVNI